MRIEWQLMIVEFMKEYINIIKSDKILRLSLLISLILILTNIVYILLVYRSLPRYIPLYNQLPWGEDRLGTTSQIFLPPMISAIILIFNSIVIVQIYKKIPLISRIMSITTLLVCMLALIFIFRTTQLVL